MSDLRLERKASSAWPAALAVGLAFGLTGGILGAHSLAVVTLPHIVNPDPILSYQEVSDLLPVPRLLDWNLNLIQTLTDLQQIHGVFGWVMAALLILALAWIVLVLLPAPAARANDHAERDAAPELQDAAQIAESTEIADAPPETPPARRKGRIAVLLPRLAVIALVLAALIRWGVPQLPDSLLRYYHTLGTFHQGYWLHLASHSLGSIVALWFAAGVLLYAALRSGITPSDRLALLPLPALLLVLSFWLQRPLQFRAIAAQKDWTPNILTTAIPYMPQRHFYGVPDGIGAARQLAAQVRLKTGNQPEQPERSLLLFYPRGALNVRMQGYSEDGLTASMDSVRPVQAFLERRRYESALSWIAIKHLYNVAVIHFDPTSAIGDCLLDMERCPHLSQCGMTARNMLFICAATPQNIALVDRWADERHFVHPTRQSQRLMGDLYLRFGAVKQAVAWYRRAEMPESFIAKVQTEKPLFHQGAITGTITLNGKPLAGVQVGVVPRRLNGLPSDLEPAVLQANRELIALAPQSALFDAGNPRPFSFRWISAGTLTDAAGHFSLNDLTEGEYTVVCTLPPESKLTPLRDPALTTVNGPSRRVVNYKTPTQDLGTIALTIHP